MMPLLRKPRMRAALIAGVLAFCQLARTPAGAATQFDSDAARAGLTATRIEAELTQGPLAANADRQIRLNRLFDFLQYTASEALAPRLGALRRRLLAPAGVDRSETAREAHAVFEKYGVTAPDTIGEAFRFGAIIPQVTDNALRTRSTARAKEMLGSLYSLAVLDSGTPAIRDMRVAVANVYFNDWARQQTLTNVLQSLVAVAGRPAGAVHPDPIGAMLAVRPLDGAHPAIFVPYIEIVHNDGSTTALEASTEGRFLAPSGRLHCSEIAAPAAAPHAALLLVPRNTERPLSVDDARLARGYIGACAAIEAQRAGYKRGVRNHREVMRDIIRSMPGDEITIADRFLDFFKVESR